MEATERMHNQVDVHTRLLTNAHHELKSEILKELSSTVISLTNKTELKEAGEHSQHTSVMKPVASFLSNINIAEYLSVAMRNAKQSP